MRRKAGASSTAEPLAKEIAANPPESLPANHRIVAKAIAGLATSG